MKSVKALDKDADPAYSRQKQLCMLHWQRKRDWDR